ncbi:MAG: thymidylate synthase [Candidatus Bathyarchaeota archaeon]|nr:thymidylate synthase [Candidatus Bathyarchaeota archaeon]
MVFALAGKEEPLALVFVYSGQFAERVIRNLINDPSFCKPCGLYCDSCKYGVYSHVRNIRAAIELPSPKELPAFIDRPETFMPKNLPKADLCVASGLHKDLLLELPTHIKKFDVKGLIVPIEDFNEVPSGLRKQLEEQCRKLGLESAFPKPFCSLEPNGNKPLISRIVTEIGIGRPELEILTKTGKYGVIEAATVKRSAPCGSTWYIARKLRGVETRKEILYDAIAKAHHSYPCTATMNVDPETREPILHMGGYIIREAVEKALEKARLKVL